jgi:hypothetical protein
MRRLAIIALIIVIPLLAACSLPGGGAPSIPTVTPTITFTPIPVDAGGGSTPTETPAPTVTPLPSLTAPPSATATPTATPTRAATTPPTAAPTWSGVTEVQIFLIAVGDNGVSGPLIGCGDSVVGVTRQIPQTRGPLRAAIAELLSIHDQHYGESGLYNALYQSSLAVDSVTIDSSGTATIQLSGTLTLGGECDDPRVEAQIEHTALQFSTVRAVRVTVNGTPLEDLLGGEG